MTKAKILIGDDEADIAMILKLQLEEHNYSTARARDGLEVLEFLKRDTYDLVLLDVRMPRLDGMKTLVRIVAESEDTAVIMMTAHGNESVAVEAMKQGAVDYVAKPFSFDDLQKRIERAIQFNRTRQENKRLQQELSAEQEKTAAILQGMADMLLAVDASGRIVQVNRATEEFLGSSRSELIGKGVSETLRADLPNERLPCVQVLKIKEPLRDVAYSLSGAQGPTPVLSNASPLISNSSLWGSVEIIRDISALKALEQEKEDFVSMLSHDLKSPITAIVGSMDLVREGRLGPVNKEQREFLDDAVESCSELVDMIDTLLDIHKFESGKMIMHFKPEGPLTSLQRLYSRYRVVARRSNISFALASEENLPPVLMDKSKFVRLAGNLLSNAFKFTPEGGEVSVELSLVTLTQSMKSRIPPGLYSGDSAATDRSYFQLVVRDSGSGIPKELQGEIFNRFVQGRNRRLGKVRGTGLGLAFCRKVMDAHSGLLWVESSPGAGSAFYALFPLTGGERE